MGMFAVYAVASLRVRVFRHFFTHWSCLDPAFEWRFPLCRSKSKHWAGLQLMIWIFPKDFRSLKTRFRNAKRTTNSRYRLLALRTKTFQLHVGPTHFRTLPKGTLECSRRVYKHERPP